MSRVTKRAIIRDEGYPVGVTAPCHINCGCGTRIAVRDGYTPCPCGMVYDEAGWIVNDRAAVES